MINSLRMVLIYAVEFLDIIPNTDALAPDWSQAPEDAQWCVIDPTGDCYWHEVDCRLCKWQRPEVTP